MTPESGAARLPVIANMAAGSLREGGGRERLAAALARAGLDAEILAVNSGQEIDDAMSRRNLRCGTVIVAGGDGTVSSVAGRISKETRMGVIPGGTFNHFARDLGIPADFEAAAGVIRAGASRAVDTGEVNGRIFLNNSSLGIYPRIVRSREAMRRRGVRKRLATALAVVAGIWTPPSLNVRLDAEGTELRCTPPYVFVGNNIYETAGRRLGARESLDSGTLCIWVARKGGRLAIIRTALAALLGRLRNSRELDMLAAREAWIETAARSVSVSIDGEVVRLESPLHYRIRPASLQVFAPAGDTRV